MLRRKGFIVFDECPSEEAEELLQTAMEKCERLANATKARKYDEAIEGLVETLLSVRNARVHASELKPHARVNVGGRGETNRRYTGGPRDYEIQTVAKIMLSIGKILISAKTSMPPQEIEDLVNSRTSQLVIEMYKRVKEWEPKVLNHGPFEIAGTEWK